MKQEAPLTLTYPMGGSKYLAALKMLSKKVVFSSAEGREAGIPYMTK